MPAIIDHPVVLQQMQQRGFRSLYHNSGAFGFATDRPLIVGWSLHDDPTVRPEMRPLLTQVDPPTVQSLAGGATRFWQERSAGRAWIMPISHWHYELDHGSAGWMPQALRAIGVDPAALAGRADGAAIEFAREESELFQRFITDLIENLTASDFMACFTDLPLLCTIHHHHQLWWQTTGETIAEALGRGSSNFQTPNSK